MQTETNRKRGKGLRKILWLTVILVCALISGCGQLPGQTETTVAATERTLEPLQPPADGDKNGPEDFVSVTLTESGSPELDFGLSSHDGAPMIRDFAITPEGTLLILQLSEKIYEYDLSGRLLDIYDLDFQSLGLTAYRITAGADGLLYLLDGRNNAVITATREGIISTSVITWTDLGLARGYFEWDDGGRLCLSAVDISVRVSGNIVATFTYAMDVTGEEAAVVERMPGNRIAGGCSFQISSSEAEENNEMYIDIYKDGVFERALCISANGGEEGYIVGLNLHGIVDGRYLVEVMEIRTNPDAPSPQQIAVQTYLLIDGETGAYQTCECDFGTTQMIRFFGDSAYFLSRGVGEITIARLEAECSGLGESEAFTVRAETGGPMSQ